MLEVIALFYLAGALGYSFVHKINNEQYKSKRKFEAIKNKNDIYYDLNGDAYFGDKKIIRTKKYNFSEGIMHDLITDYNGNVLKDYTDDKIFCFFLYINNTIKKAKQNGDNYFYIDGYSCFPNEIAEYGKLCLKYSGLYETETGKRYIIRNKTKVYYKELECKSDMFYYMLDSNNSIRLTNEEINEWGGNVFNFYNKVALPKGSIIEMKGVQKYEWN